MDKITGWIIRHKIIVVVVFAVLAALGQYLSGFVRVNYSFQDYLPEDTASTKGLEVMEAEFSQGVPNCRVMVDDVTVAEALQIKKDMLAVEGVQDVNWLDDAVNILQPLDTFDQDTVRSWYRDGKALFVLTIDKTARDTAIPAIRAIIGDDAAMTGTLVDTYISTNSTSTELATMFFWVIPIVLCILWMTTRSWLEPLLFLATIGVAILIGRGTNIFIGEISFVTNAASAILQLAVSLDYSVFLLHRFEECRGKGMAAEEAICAAAKSSFSSILSSGLTTVIGFVALCCMRFRIGQDMGVVMAKAVVLSLLSVFIFMPALLMLCYPTLEKTRHRSFLPSFRWLGTTVSRAGLPLLLIGALLAPVAFLGQKSNSFLYGSSKISTGAGTEYGQEVARIQDTFGESNTLVLLVPKGDLAREKEVLTDIRDIPEVSSVISYVATVGETIPVEFVPQQSLSLLMSENYSRFILTVNTEQEGKAAFRVIEQLRKISAQYYEQSYLVGESVVAYDMRSVVLQDNIVVTVVAIAAIFIVLLFMLQSLSLPLLLVLLIESAVWINLAIPYFRGDTMFYIAYLILGSVQLGATVDYAILFTDRYCQCRREMTAKNSVREAVRLSAPSILTSAAILCAGGYTLGLTCTNGVISEIGELVGRGALISMVMVLLVLPTVLRYLDAFLQKTSRKLVFYTPEKKETENKKTPEAAE